LYVNRLKMKIFNYRTLVLLSFMLIMISIRVIAPLSPDFKAIANLSGIGAIALFGGTYLKDRTSAFLLPMLVLFLSDLGLALTMGKDYGFYEGWYYTYIAFALMVLVARLIIKKVNFQNLFLATLIGVVIHWLISDIGTWQYFDTYPHTFSGYIACLIGAIPYELNFLYGTAIYAAIMFAAFEGLKLKFPSLKLARIK
jgi:hypothetical protein